jgi:uncharacterized protein
MKQKTRRGQKQNSLLKPTALIVLWIIATATFADSGKIAVIIDDMGYSYRSGAKALQLPGEVTFAFLPKAPYTQKLAKSAHRKGKEIMVHLPMQSITGHTLDEGALVMDMTRRHFYLTLLQDIDAVPNAVGVNNHMGSLLTRHPGAMQWLMKGLKTYGGLYFIDSITSDDSVAGSIAAENGVPTASRDVFLDHHRDRKKIRHQFQRLIKTAKANGAAVGIGHPYPETMAVLREMFPKLAQQGVTLVKASKLVKATPRRQKKWRASLSHSLKVVKSLRRSQ